MPLIDNVKRINADDFPDEDRETVGRIAETYNFFAEQVTNTLNGRVDFENLTKNLIEIEVTLGSNGVPIQTTRFSASTGLLGTSVRRADNLTNVAAFPLGAPFITFSASGSGIYTIQHITGLIPGNNYRLIVELDFN